MMLIYLAETANKKDWEMSYFYFQNIVKNDKFVHISILEAANVQTMNQTGFTASPTRVPA